MSSNKQKEKDIKTIPIVSNSFTEAEIFISDNYDLRFNNVSLGFEGKNKNDKEFKPLNENNLYRDLQKSGLKISMNQLIILLKSDFVEQYDPLINYFESLPKWDGIDHIKNLSIFVNANDQDQFNYHFKKNLVRIVACAINPNYFNKQAFILVHNKQNSGKSTFCRFLCPSKLSNYIAEDIATDKDSRILIVKNLLINLDELASISKKDINSLKAMFSKIQINERLPFDKKNSIIKRRCSFVGSTNQTQFLTDETGSVRWLCFEIDSIDWQYSKKIDMNKVYSQALHLYNDSSFEMELSPTDIKENEIRNSAYQMLTVERELIQTYFEPDYKKHPANFKNATDIIMRLQTITENSFRLNNVQIGKALRFLKYPTGRNNRGFSGYYLKECINT